jgi:hypothetical protein
MVIFLLSSTNLTLYEMFSALRRSISGQKVLIFSNHSKISGIMIEYKDLRRST